MESWGSISSIAFRMALAAMLTLAGAWARADAPPSLDAGVEQQVRQLALAGSQPGAGARIEVEVGQLDGRLRLAPCQRVEPHLPAGTRLWGRTRIGLRCVQGESRWNVFLPVTVKVYAQALVAAAPLAVGRVLAADDVTVAEVDLAEDTSAAMTRPELVVGRSLGRAVNAGQSLRQAHLKPRQWFAAGETVKVVALGSGFSVASEGQAMTPGLEGQPARVKTESGRVLTGMPVGERRMELSL
ncbi:flagellar basal body P-ring formation chaperone FlgA [Piscinibacter sp. XHJ-5]|uniref:flagellar basal body P-ring formation chaperone FlgA n=1 Tax=Piscinibacter sp. XHJ-5 TaxID=3037797 RepID=UPI002452BA3A|nr:flagellar basal body P-ring formation chaperone FlgA [Piscinibacter sp. XHJ-5]